MATVEPNLTLRPDAKVFYPERDGKPMAESDVHQDVMYALKEGLLDHFQPAPAVYVASNLFLYYQQGDPTQVVAPDVMVLLTAGYRRRRSFKVWEEGGRTPDLVIEVSSKSTRREDLRGKMDLYRDVLKVPEYLLFDPLGEYLKPRLRGFRLHDGQYEPITPEDGRIRSQTLGLLFGAVGETLRLYDGATGQLIPTRVEQLRASRDDRATERNDAMQMMAQSQETIQNLLKLVERQAKVNRRTTATNRKLQDVNKSLTVAYQELMAASEQALKSGRQLQSQVENLVAESERREAAVQELRDQTQRQAERIDSLERQDRPE